LFKVQVPMLFLQGTRDEFASLELLKGLVEQLGANATLKLVEDADHSFHVPKRSGRTDVDVRAELLDAAWAWMSKVSELSGDGRSATL
jgi:pimeloyl-ACP methyl ester carboxylesterase